MKNRDRGTIIISTFSDEQSVRELARNVLDARLCACVNFTRINSMYLWKGKLKDHEEFIALFKTTRRSAEKLKKAIAMHHPYEVPEIVELKMSNVSAGYLLWLAAETSSNRIAQKRHNTAK
ncbi:MAG: divalent cation tolerance protein CutA [Nitrososphaera sp.]